MRVHVRAESKGKAGNVRVAIIKYACEPGAFHTLSLILPIEQMGKLGFR